MNPYEQDRVLHTYLLFHYGTREQILHGSPLESGVGAALSDDHFRFPVATVADTFHLADAPFERALDLGCAVGRSSFELSRHAREVIGIDYSHAFIEAAEALRDGQTLSYHRYSEAQLWDVLLAAAPAEARPQAIQFEVGDAQHLRHDLGAFDLVHAANLLCRL
ncbi:MAG: methyltransferase domain-containing protein, partial [Verrucomicrobiae bacterium]|nr:methyltransferase domain-containing protein [Verrucomicrobiae bacterium]